MEEPSLLERVLKAEKDEKLACIMALDLILVGIDTVRRPLIDLIQFSEWREDTSLRDMAWHWPVSSCGMPVNKKLNHKLMLAKISGVINLRPKIYWFSIITKLHGEMGLVYLQPKSINVPGCIGIIHELKSA